jgi:cyclohexadieny/prephenate dehydrogenase
MSAAQNPIFDKVAIIGIGLIGSSIARAVRKHKLAKHIAIADASEEARKIAAELKLGESVHADPGEAAKDADLTLVCVPIAPMPRL